MPERFEKEESLRLTAEMAADSAWRHSGRDTGLRVMTQVLNQTWIAHSGSGPWQSSHLQ